MIIKDKRPVLFEKSTCNIWTDPHIQQQMLKEHLNPFSDGASRKQESILKITDFILNHIQPSGNLLDLGCGPGLYTSLFKDNGFNVTGIDFNKATIDYASSQRKDIKYILGDYIKNYPSGRYNSVIMIYCDFGTHSDSERNKLLTNIYNSLEEGGMFIFDIFTEAIVQDKHEGKSWDYAPEGGFWHENKYLLLNETFHYPEDKAFGYQYNLLMEDNCKHFIVWDRYYSEDEITKVLLNSGFREITIHKSISTGNNFTSSNEMFIAAKK